LTKRGLGKGLSALIPAIDTGTGEYIQQVPIGRIRANPNQPRKRFDETAFSELVASIREVGLVQPVVVRPKEDGYELIAGERRWKAAKEAGLENIPAVIKSSSDAESLEIALIENLQREDLNAIEEANAYILLSEAFDLKQEEIAKRVGKQRTTVTNIMRLLKLSPEVQQLVIDGLISSGHARALLGIEDVEQQLRTARKIVEQGLTVRQVENIARRVPLEKHRESRPQPKVFKDMADRISTALGASVQVKMAGTKGKIEISFPLDKLSEVVQRLLEHEISDAMAPKKEI
jgi:ParB family chromosome partitioning protein